MDEYAYDPSEPVCFACHDDGCPECQTTPTVPVPQAADIF